MSLKIKSILAVRNDRFGEFLLNIPAFRALKEAFPGSRLVLAVNPYLQELAGCIDCLDELILWENRRHNLREIFKFAGELKRRKFDLCAIFNPSKEFNIISFLAGIPIRVGYARKWGFLLTRKIEDEKYLGDRHEIEYNLDLLKQLGVPAEKSSLSLRTEDNGLFDEFKSRAVALHPWTSDSLKQWPLENFAELAKKLAEVLNLKVLIVGGKLEVLRSQQYFSGPSNNIVNLTGKTTLKELALLLKKCRLLISGDSGPVHLASCVQTPVIALFRADMPEKGSCRWGPKSPSSIIIEKNRLADITVDEVFAKAKDLLTR